MVSPRSCTVLIIATIFSSVKSSMDGSIESCPTDAFVDLTRSIPDSSGSVKKGGIIFPPNYTPRHRSGRRLGCPCSFKTCLSLCCPSGMARVEGSCVEDNETLGILPAIVDSDDEENYVSEQNYHLFMSDPCAIGWMVSFIIRNFDVFENGSIYAPEFKGGSLLDFEHYCLMRTPKSNGYFAKVCHPWMRKSYYDMFCAVTCSLIVMGIFIVYTVVPELRNLHGLIFRSYVATYILFYWASLGMMNTAESRTLYFWFDVSDITTRYFGACCTCWLTVMSFNIWRSFRGIGQISCHSRAKRRRLFIWYAIYAWISPIVLFLFAAALIIYVPYFRTDTIADLLKKWGSLAIVMLSLVCNTLLHTSTAINIKRQKNDTAHLAHGIKHYEVDIQWFNLSLKLFLVMGGHIFTWAIWLIWPSSATTHLLCTMEVVQSILIIVIFGWTRNVRRSLRKRFTGNWVSNYSSDTGTNQITIRKVESDQEPTV